MDQSKLANMVGWPSTLQSANEKRIACKTGMQDQ
jgi:hypothetical protein